MSRWFPRRAQRIAKLLVLSVLECAGCTGNERTGSGLALSTAGGASVGAAASGGGSANDTVATAGGGSGNATGGVTSGGAASGGDDALAGSAGMPEPPATPGDASFHDLAASAMALGEYDTLVVTVHSSVAYQNSSDQDDIAADLVLTAPDATTVVMPAFAAGGQSGDTTWEAHFTPQQRGRYHYRMRITTASGAVVSDQLILDVMPSALDGFLHLSPGAAAYDLVFDSGKRFRGVGENFGWETDKYKFADMLPRLKSVAVNFVRTWEGPGRYVLQQQLPLSHFNPEVTAKLDQVMQLARDNGIYVMSTLEPAIYYLTTPNGGDQNVQWAANAFSTAKGGPCPSTADFFTNPEAKRHYKNKLRYSVAHWGADPHLAVWEFWNEYDHLVEQLGVPTAAIASWHREMGQYLRTIDPYGRIITTSLSHNDYADLWSLPEMQFSQRHLYGSTESLAGTIGSYEAKYQKPFVSGEFSLDWKWPQMHPASEYGRELHLGLWRGMFAPTPILPLTWWWDFHADNNQYFHFAYASAMAAKTAQGPGPLEPQSITASSNVEALALKSPSGRFVWVHNQGAGQLGGASVTLTGVPDGGFTLRSLDPWTGVWSEPSAVSASGGSLKIELTTLAGDQDLAYWLAAL